LTRTETEVWLEDQPDLKISRVSIEGNRVDIRISGEGTLPDVAVLEEDLELELGTDVVVRVEFFPSVVVTSDES
jgi:hypothetical protein